MIPTLRLPFMMALGAQPTQGAATWLQFLPFILVIGIFYLLVLRPARTRQKKVQEFQAALKVGDRVVTTAGIYGQITRVSEKSVQVQIAPNVKIEVARAAVGGLQGQDPIVQDQGTV